MSTSGIVESWTWSRTRPVLNELHWLPVLYIIKFTLALVIFAIHTRRCPDYTSPILCRRATLSRHGLVSALTKPYTVPWTEIWRPRHKTWTFYDVPFLTKRFAYWLPYTLALYGTQIQTRSRSDVVIWNFQDGGWISPYSWRHYTDVIRSGSALSVRIT